MPPFPALVVEGAADMVEDPERRLDVLVGQAGQRIAP